MMGYDSHADMLGGLFAISLILVVAALVLIPSWINRWFEKRKNSLPSAGKLINTNILVAGYKKENGKFWVLDPSQSSTASYYDLRWVEVSESEFKALLDYRKLTGRYNESFDLN